MTWHSCSASPVASLSSCRAASSSRARRPKSPPMRACARSTSASGVMTDCLELHGVSAGYGETVVLESVSLAVEESGTLAVLGRDGVGKTTLLATMLGHTTLHG